MIMIIHRYHLHHYQTLHYLCHHHHHPNYLCCCNCHLHQHRHQQQHMKLRLHCGGQLKYEKSRKHKLQPDLDLLKLLWQILHTRLHQWLLNQPRQLLLTKL